MLTVWYSTGPLYKLPSRSGQSPSAKQFLVHFEVKLHLSPLLYWMFSVRRDERRYNRQDSRSASVLARLMWKMCVINVRVWWCTRLLSNFNLTRAHWASPHWLRHCLFMCVNSEWIKLTTTALPITLLVPNNDTSLSSNPAITVPPLLGRMLPRSPTCLSTL